MQLWWRLTIALGFTLIYLVAAVRPERKCDAAPAASPPPLRHHQRSNASLLYKERRPPSGQQCCCNQNLAPICRALPKDNACPEEPVHGSLEQRVSEDTPDLTYRQNACLGQDAAAFRFPLKNPTDPRIRLVFTPESLCRISRIQIKGLDVGVHIERNTIGQVLLSVQGTTPCKDGNAPADCAYARVRVEDLDLSVPNVPDFNVGHLEMGVAFKLRGEVGSFQEAWEWDGRSAILEHINVGHIDTSVLGGKTAVNLFLDKLEVQLSLQLVKVVSKLIAQMPEPTGAGSGMQLQSLSFSAKAIAVKVAGKSLTLEWTSEQLWTVHPDFMAQWLCRGEERCKMKTKFTDILQPDENGVAYPKTEPLQVKTDTGIVNGGLDFAVHLTMALNIPRLLEALDPECTSSDHLCVRSLALPSNTQSNGKRIWLERAQNLAPCKSIPCLVLSPPQIRLQWKLTITPHRDSKGPGLFMQLEGADSAADAAEMQCAVGQWLCIGVDTCNLARDVLGDSLSLELAIRRFGVIVRPSEKGSMALESCFVEPCREGSGLVAPLIYVALLTPTASVRFMYEAQHLQIEVGLQTNQLTKAFTNRDWTVDGGTRIRGKLTGHRLSISKTIGNENLDGSIGDVGLTELSGRLFLDHELLQLAAALDLHVGSWSCSHWLCGALSSTMLGSMRLRLEVQLDGRIAGGKFNRSPKIAPTLTMLVTGQGSSDSSLFAHVVVNTHGAVMNVNVQVALKTFWQKWHTDFINNCDDNSFKSIGTCERLRSLQPKKGQMQLIIPINDTKDEFGTFEFNDLSMSAKASLLAQCHTMPDDNLVIRVIASINQFDIVLKALDGTHASAKWLKKLAPINGKVRVAVSVMLVGFIGKEGGFVACRDSTKEAEVKATCSKLFGKQKTAVVISLPGTILPDWIVKRFVKGYILDALNKLVTDLAPVLHGKLTHERQCIPNSLVSVSFGLERVNMMDNEIGMKASIEASSLGGGVVTALFESFGVSIVEGIEGLLPAAAALHGGGAIEFHMNEFDETPYRPLFGENEALRLEFRASHPLAEALGRHMQDLSLQLGQTLSGQVSSNLMSQYNVLLLSMRKEFRVAAKIKAETLGQTLKASAAFTMTDLHIAQHLTVIPGASEGDEVNPQTLYDMDEWSKSGPMEWSPPMEREPFELFTAYMDTQLHSKLTFDGLSLNVEASGHAYIDEERMFRSLMDSAQPRDFGFIFGAGLSYDGQQAYALGTPHHNEYLVWLNCGLLRLYDPAEVAAGRNGMQSKPKKDLNLLHPSTIDRIEGTPCFQLAGQNMNNDMESLKLCFYSAVAVDEWGIVLSLELERLQKMAQDETCEVKGIDGMLAARVSHICNGPECNWVVAPPWSITEKLAIAVTAKKSWWRTMLS